MKNNETQGFRIPEGYFDQLERQIFEKTVDSKKKYIFPLYAKMLSAASIILLISLSFYFFKEFNENKIVQEEKKILNELYHSIYLEDHLEIQLAELESEDYMYR